MTQDKKQQESNDIDMLALAAASAVMEVVNGPRPIGGDIQMTARIQCIIIEALKKQRERNNGQNRKL